MKLNLQELQDQQQWTDKGYKLPQYNIETVRSRTLAEPGWIHFGAGNIFRVFPAVLQQQLLNAGLAQTGIIVAEAFDEEIIDKAYTPFDNLSLMVSLNANGSIDKEVVASVVHSLKPSTQYEELAKYFVQPSLQMISFTITEKGYAVKGSDGNYFNWIAADLDCIPEKPGSIISLLTKLLNERYMAGEQPLALVSMDNCAHNGTRLYEAVMTFANAWAHKNLVESGFIAYLNNREKISFTWSMIDKITPRPSDVVQKSLIADGYESTDIIITAKNTYTASFVNAEPTQYLVIEDWFPNGRPPLEHAGVIFTDRETVDKVETMKVTTCLNPLHTVLAIYGCLLRKPTIADCMKDPQLKAFVEKVGYVEGMPVVVDPGIIKPEEFINTVLEERFPNPFLPDTPERIATDTSQKIPIRFGETMKAYLAEGGPAALQELVYIPLFIAGWLRYLLGCDDWCEQMNMSPDPMLEELQHKLAWINLGNAGPFGPTLNPILANKAIFGIDLVANALAPKIIGYFTELVAGEGAVRSTLIKYLPEE